MLNFGKVKELVRIGKLLGSNKKKNGSNQYIELAPITKMLESPEEYKLELYFEGDGLVIKVKNKRDNQPNRKRKIKRIVKHVRSKQ